MQFQSLFWWKSEIKFSQTIPSFLQRFLFQSLFWWKSEIKSKYFYIIELTDQCFNPCFGGNQKSNQNYQQPKLCQVVVSILVLVEIRNQIPTKTNLKTLTPKFQSLFWWKSEIKSQYLSTNKKPWLRFNPCFGGNQKSNRFVNTDGPVFTEFQSLFWWKSEIKSNKNKSKNLDSQVSILVLVEIRNQIENCYLSIDSGLRFQSLFWWKSEIKFSCFPSLAAYSPGFNPCFGGNQKSNRSAAGLIPHLLLWFQSLFWWKSEIKFSKLYSRLKNLPEFQSLFWWKSEIKLERLECIIIYYL